MQTVFQPGDRRVERAVAFRHHPAFETPRERDRREFDEDLARECDAFRVQRARFESARILEGGWPC